MAMSSFVAAITLVFLVFILKVPARSGLKPAEVEFFCVQIYNICTSTKICVWKTFQFFSSNLHEIRALNCYVMSPHMI